jgi:small subunit ribosomal protein S8
MSMSDPIADMLTRIRNAQGVQKTTVKCRRRKSKLRLPTS